MQNSRWLLLLGLMLGAFNAAAENALFVLPFGGEPGTPLAHAYNYGAPPVQEGVYLMRVPSADSEIAKMLVDFELTIDAATNTVLHSRAARAYRALPECVAAQQVIAQKLSLALPHTYAGAGSSWQHQSADGRQVGGSYCRQERHLPFPILTFELTTAPR